jgi:hypothetical protein
MNAYAVVRWLVVVVCMLLLQLHLDCVVLLFCKKC